MVISFPQFYTNYCTGLWQRPKLPPSAAGRGEGARTPRAPPKGCRPLEPCFFQILQREICVLSLFAQMWPLGTLLLPDLATALMVAWRLSMFSCSEGFKRHFLGFSYPCYTCDIHAFVRPIASQRFDACSCQHIPEFRCPIVAATGKSAAIRTECHRPHATAMLAHDLETLSCVQIPDTYSLILAATGKKIAIWADCHCPDPMSMPIQYLELLT